MVSFIGLCGGHPHPLQTYIYIYIYIYIYRGSIEHKYLPHANVFGNNALVNLRPDIFKNLIPRTIRNSYVLALIISYILSQEGKELRACNSPEFYV